MARRPKQNPTKNAFGPFPGGQSESRGDWAPLRVPGRQIHVLFRFAQPSTFTQFLGSLHFLTLAALVALATNGAAGGQKQAAWAFSRLAHDNAANRVAIREAGGIPPVVALVRSGAADCQEAAVMALGNLAYNNPANQAAIVAAGAVGPLVALVRVGAIRLGGHSREAEWALKMLDLAAIASRLQTLQAEEASRKRDDLRGSLDWDGQDFGGLQRWALGVALWLVAQRRNPLGGVF